LLNESGVGWCHTNFIQMLAQPPVNSLEYMNRQVWVSTPGKITRAHVKYRIYKYSYYNPRSPHASLSPSILGLAHYRFSLTG